MAGPETQARSGLAGLRLLGVLAAFAPAPASAGAWIVTEGPQHIATEVLGQRGEDEVVYSEIADYWELPVDNRSSVVFAPWVEAARDIDRGQRGEAVVAYKRLIFSNGGTAMAMQAGAFWQSEPGEGCSEGGVELRWLGGTSFDEGAGFVNMEVAERALEGGCSHAKLDVTVGYHASPHWMGMGQVFTEQSWLGDESVKAQLTVVHFGRNPRAGTQVGLRVRLDGGEPEPALVLAFWSQPGD